MKLPAQRYHGRIVCENFSYFPKKKHKTNMKMRKVSLMRDMTEIFNTIVTPTKAMEAAIESGRSKEEKEKRDWDEVRVRDVIFVEEKRKERKGGCRIVGFNCGRRVVNVSWRPPDRERNGEEEQGEVSSDEEDSEEEIEVFPTT